MKEVFCDGVSHVILSRGLVSVEFFHLVLEGEGPHKRVPFFSITLPIKGILEILGTGEKILDYMVKAGAITIVAPDTVSVNGKAIPAPAAEKKPEKKNAKSQPAPARKSAPASAKKADAKPAEKPAAPAKKSAPASAKKAEAKPAEKPAAPAKKSAPASVKKAAPAPAKKTAKGKKSAK